jgi:hypothetical protein
VALNIYFFYTVAELVDELDGTREALQFFIHAQHVEYTYKDPRPKPLTSSSASRSLDIDIHSDSSEQIQERERLLENSLSYFLALFGPYMSGTFDGIEQTPAQLAYRLRKMFFALTPSNQTELIEQIMDMRREISKLVRDSPGNELESALQVEAMVAPALEKLAPVLLSNEIADAQEAEGLRKMWEGLRDMERRKGDESEEGEDDGTGASSKSDDDSRKDGGDKGKGGKGGGYSIVG